MGLLLFSIDDDLDTDLDTPVWDGALHDVIRYDALARELEHRVARESGSANVLALASALRTLAARAASGTYRELFAQGGIVGGFIEAAYAAARDAAAGATPSLDAAIAAQKRLDAVTD